MATQSPGTGGEAGPDASGRTANRTLVWAWIIGLLLLGAIVWGVGRLAAGIAPDYRAAGVNTGASGTRDSNAPGGLPTPAGTSLPTPPPPKTISSDKTYQAPQGAQASH